MAARARRTSWQHVHPLVQDVGLAALLVVTGLVGLFVTFGPEQPTPVDALAVLLVLGQAVPVAWRRRFPCAVVAVTAGSTLVADAQGYAITPASLGLLVAIYSVAAYARRDRALLTASALGTTMVVWAGAWWLVGGADDVGLDDIAGNLIAFVAAFLLGDVVRRRRERVEELEERARRLERERELEVDRAAQRERARIARELHDVVAHSVTVMVVQAGAARRVAGTDPDGAAEAMQAIERTGREALDELRRLLGVLRRDDDADARAAAALAPQPSLAEVAELAAADPSLPVSISVEGTPVMLPPSVEVSAYRIVQEALTNVRKHAGPAHASVVLRYGDDRLEVEVVDDGRGAGAVAPPGEPGHGLTGMRERASSCGGELRAGPNRGGGWQVRAALPYHPTRVGAA